MIHILSICFRYSYRLRLIKLRKWSKALTSSSESLEIVSRMVLTTLSSIRILLFPMRGKRIPMVDWCVMKKVKTKKSTKKIYRNSQKISSERKKVSRRNLPWILFSRQTLMDDRRSYERFSGGFDPVISDDKNKVEVSHRKWYGSTDNNCYVVGTRLAR